VSHNIPHRRYVIDWQGSYAWTIAKAIRSQAMTRLSRSACPDNFRVQALSPGTRR